MSSLLAVHRIEQDTLVFVRRCGTVVAEFGHLTQDSGNVSWLVESDGRRLFVKTAGTDAPPVRGAPVPYFDHAGRVALLRNAVDIARSCRHRVLPALLNVIETPSGPALVYEAVSGELIHVPREQRDDPTSSYQRFAHLPASTLFGIFDTLIDLHVALADAGWVAGDLYTGCLILDFETSVLRVVDLDSYRRGPSVNDMGRMFGSTSSMAPEEFVLGARIDECTTVFTLGRLVWQFATRLTEHPADFCGTEALADVIRRACEQSPAARYLTVADLAEAWLAAR